MRIYIVLLALAVISTDVCAKWVTVAESDAGVLFADPETIRKRGKLVKIWTLFDLFEVEVRPGLSRLHSSKGHVEFDCSEENQRTLYFSNHTEPMGHGEISFVNSIAGEWRSIPPNSLGRSMLKFACGKK